MSDFDNFHMRFFTLKFFPLVLSVQVSVGRSRYHTALVCTNQDFATFEFKSDDRGAFVTCLIKPLPDWQTCVVSMIYSCIENKWTESHVHCKNKYRNKKNTYLNKSTFCSRLKTEHAAHIYSISWSVKTAMWWHVHLFNVCQTALWFRAVSAQMWPLPPAAFCTCPLPPSCLLKLHHSTGNAWSNCLYFTYRLEVITILHLTVWELWRFVIPKFGCSGRNILLLCMYFNHKCLYTHVL